MNELTLYNYNAAALMVAPVPRTGNYTICAPDGVPATLKRGIDFGMIRKKNGDAMTKNPTLFKSGAEKVPRRSFPGLAWKRWIFCKTSRNGFWKS